MDINAFFPDSILSHGQSFAGMALLTEAGRVKGIVSPSDVPVSARRTPLPGLTLAAGLVDAQVNGGGGALFNDDPLQLATVEKAHVACGTTAFLPTLISERPEKIPSACAAVADYRRAHPDSAVMGLHLEGPFLNPERHGIHPRSHIRPPDESLLAALDAKACGALLVTLAPECVPPALIAALAAKGVIISAGHSMADAAQLAAARAAGLSGVTHLYNAMGGLSARAPGLAGLALDDDALACGLIADGAHVAPAMIRLAVKAKPEGKIFLVSDAMPPAGQHPPQDFTLMGKAIRVRARRCEDADGHLAGSALTLFDCMKHMVRDVGIPLARAHAMASLAPARFLRLEGLVGSLEPGKRADFIGFDSNLELKSVWRNGTPVR